MESLFISLLEMRHSWGRFSNVNFHRLGKVIVSAVGRSSSCSITFSISRHCAIIISSRFQRDFNMVQKETSIIFDNCNRRIVKGALSWHQSLCKDFLSPFPTLGKNWAHSWLMWKAKSQMRRCILTISKNHRLALPKSSLLPLTFYLFVQLHLITPTISNTPLIHLPQIHDFLDTCTVKETFFNASLVTILQLLKALL